MSGRFSSSSDRQKKRTRAAGRKGGKKSRKREPDWHTVCAAAWTKLVDDEELALLKAWNKANDTEERARARRELEVLLDRYGASSEEFRKAIERMRKLELPPDQHERREEIRRAYTGRRAYEDILSLRYEKWQSRRELARRIRRLIVNDFHGVVKTIPSERSIRKFLSEPSKEFPGSQKLS